MNKTILEMKQDQQEMRLEMREGFQYLNDGLAKQFETSALHRQSSEEELSKNVAFIENKINKLEKEFFLANNKQ